MSRLINLTIDVNSRKVTKYQDLVKLGDDLSLSITCLNSSTAYDFTNKSVHVFLKKADNTKVEQTLTISGNVLSVATLDAQASTKVGQVDGELVIMDAGNNVQITSSVFIWEVEGTISDEALVTSTDSIETLVNVNNALAEYATKKDALIIASNNADAKITQIETDISTANTVKTALENDIATAQSNEFASEIITARGGKTSLDERLDEINTKIGTGPLTTTSQNIIGAINENTASLSEKAQKIHVNVKDFGAIGNAKYFNETDGNYYADNTFTTLANDDTDAIYNAIQSVYTASGTFEDYNVIIEFPTAHYLISRTLSISANIDIDFMNSIIQPIKNFTGKNMFMSNTTDGTTWIVQYTHNWSTFKNAWFKDYNKQGLRILLQGDTRTVENITTLYMGSIVQSLAYYIDHKCAKNINIYAPSSSDYQIDYIGQGDGIEIDKVHVFGSTVATNQQTTDSCSDSPGSFINLIKLLNQSANITNIINGRIYAHYGSIVNIENWHCEDGQLLCIDSNVNLKSSFFFKRPTKYTPIFIIDDNSNKTGHIATLENIEFCNIIEKEDYTVDRVDIDVANASGIVTVKNCNRRFSPTSMYYYIKNSCGILVQGLNTKYYQQKNEMVFSNGVLINEFSIAKNSARNSYAGIEDVGNTYKGNIGTITYNIYEVFDISRQLGKKLGTHSVTLADASRLVVLIHDKISFGSLVLITKTVGSNNYYVYIPYVMDSKSYDDGYAVNGYSWISGTPNTTFTDIDYYANKNLIECIGMAYPTVGLWAKGDSIINSNATEVGTTGSMYMIEKWKCTVAGTPGTWIQCRTLTGN